ncbi:tetratricopeptide repeat protein [Streptomyces brasiliscabiei]|uniref:Tetratricopeptide repeat protein n=1 Tax=Streptomyces brasiliscabiei TaxID=2736302 RepID=A0ABU8GM28_9ACTN
MSASFGRHPVEDSSASASATASGAGAVAARGDVGLAQTGAGSFGVHIGHATLLSPENFPAAASVDCPPGISNLPSRAPLFVGRDHELTLLDEALAAPGEAVVHAMHGLGGIGKSTLAVRWATLRGPDHAPGWWITADSRAALDSGLAALAKALKPTLAALLPQEQLSEWARQWLASHTGWLLVLDNVSDPADVEHLLARATSGRFLITSRRATGWRSMAREVPLDVLSEEEAVDLFTRIRGADPDTAALCEELGHLPLAVAQAAAYCVETGCSVRAYLDDLAAYPAEMYEATDAGGDHRRAVARVWHITLDRLADDPLAVRILLMIAWYASEEIPRSVLAGLGTPPAVRRALGRLAAHSMITLHEDTVSAHRLVQAVSRTPGRHDHHRHPDAIASARESAVAALTALIPEDEDAPVAWRAARAVLPHIEALAGYGPPGTGTEAEAGLCLRGARQLVFSGTRSALRAITLIDHAEVVYTRLLGAEARQTLEARVELVRARRLASGPRAAVALADAVLADCVRVLGERHPLTLTACMRVARTAGLMGDSARARELLEKVVEGRASTLGDRHPRTLEARGHRAMELRDHEDLVSVRSALQQVHEDCVESLGPEHPVTLSVQSKLLLIAPSSRIMEGPIGKAVASWALTGSGFVLGDLLQHFDTVLGSMSAQDLRRAMKLEGDVEAAEQHVATYERVFGEDHPKTLTAKMTLVQAYVSTRDVDRGAAVLEQLVADATPVFGGDDSFVAAMSAVRGLVDLAPFPVPRNPGRSEGDTGDPDGAEDGPRRVVKGGPAPEELARWNDLLGTLGETITSGTWDPAAIVGAMTDLLKTERRGGPAAVGDGTDAGADVGTDAVVEEGN